MSNAFDTATDANAGPPLPMGKGDMPGAGKTDNMPSKSFDDMTGGSDPQYDAITKADTALTKQKIGAEAGMESIRKRQDDAYAARQERMLAQEGATMEDLKPWNAAKELNNRKTDLWEQFGSPGFVIAMLASTFTAMPMNSALNAGAAAMNAINQGDMDNYNKAFDAWKENSNLTLKRLDVEEREFEQIDHLRSKSMESWRSAATALATRFNDQRMLVMLQNGYDSQALEARDALVKSKVEISDATKRIQDNETRRQVTMALLGDSKDPKKLAQAASDAETIMQSPKTPEQMAVANVISQPGFRDLPSEEQSKQINSAIAGVSSARYGGRGAGSTPLELQKQLDASDAGAPADEPPDDARERHNAIMADYYKSKNPIGAERNKITQAHQTTMEDLASRKIDIEEAKAQEDALHKQNMDAIAKGRLEGQMTAQQEKARHDAAMEEITKTKNAAGNITPNKRAELTQLETRYQVNDDIIDDVINTLKRDPSGAGLKGKVMRLEERLANILGGTSSTKYVEVMRQIETARALTPRLLIGGSSRPLKTEADRMDSIVPGLTIGDTWQNTIAGLQKLKETLDKEHATVKEILGDTSTTEAPAKPAPDEWPGIPVSQ